jgi:tetratricopeptide (TPR) repeat protein
VGVRERYWQAYYQLARQLYFDDTQHPLQSRAIVRRELPNLRRALTLALQAGALDAAVNFAESINMFLNNFGRWRERDEVMAEVSGVIDQVSGEEGELTQAQFVMESQRGERLLQMGQAGQAERVFRGLLARMAESHPEPVEGWGYERMVTLTRLGRCLRAQGQPSEAEAHYRQAIKVAEKLEQSEGVKRHIGAIHTDLADVLAEQGRYAQAEKEYKTGLELATEVDDERQQGVVLGQLGTLALRQKHYAEARRRYIEAIDTFRRMGEEQHQAIYLHQLGVVAEEQAQRVGAQQDASHWDEAARCYRESLAIKERINDLAGAAGTANQLANVAVGAGRPAQAKRWYLRAIELGEELNYTGELGKWYSNLADLYLSQNRLDEAETYAHKAREIIETLDISAQPWINYSLLARIADAKGDDEEARRWRRKEQETFATFPGNRAHLANFQQLITDVARAAQGEEKLKAQIRSTFPQLKQGNWQIVDAIEAIWAGERDWYVLTEGIDSNSALLVRMILEQVTGESPGDQSPGSKPKGAPSSPAEGQGISLGQLFELVERAAGASTEPGRSGEQELGQQLFATFQQLSADPNAPAELRELAKVLVLVLIGERDPDLDALEAQSSELASAVRGLLGRLRHA